MPDLLIHSMSEFSDIILGVLTQAGAQHVAEIGAEYGGMSTLLADYTAERGGQFSSIDPAPKPQFVEWAAATPHVRHIVRPSLEAFAELENVDAWLIDGDHNWYTVYHELKQIDALCRRDGRPMLAFLHDIDWPAGRRDMYYAPDQIPAEYRHAHDYEGGAFPGEARLQSGRGFRGMGHFALATHEGGPRNGVRTAVEDFIAELAAEGREMALAEIPAVFGLGILFDMDAPWSQAVAEMVIPFHQNRLLAALEQNRLANYLTVLEWQDQSAT